MEHNKELKTFNFKAFLEKRRNKENGIQRKVDRISHDERMDKMITELSKEMDMQKRQLARMYTNNSDTDTVEDTKGGVSTYYQTNWTYDGTWQFIWKF